MNRSQLRNDYGLRIATWNIQTLTGKEPELVDEMKKYKVDILGVSEARKKASGTKILNNNYVLRYSGTPWNERAKEGVAIIVSEEMDSKITQWEAVSSRLIWVDVELTTPVTIVQAYGPTDDQDRAEKDAFFEELQRLVDKAESRRRKVIVMGDLNGRVGKARPSSQGVIGPWAGEDVKNGNGNRIIDFCLANSMIISYSFYKHKRIHQITFESTQHSSIIDYILIPKDLKNKCRDVKVVRGAEISTDHHLLVGDMVFARERRRKRTSFCRVKYEKLKEQRIRERYQETLESKLHTNLPGQDEVEEKWQRLKSSIVEAANEECGIKKVKEGVKKTKWWNKQEVERAVAEKKRAWKEWKRCRTQISRDEYVNKRNLCKNVIMNAKRESWERFGEELERNYRQENSKFWKFLRSQRGKFGKRVRSIRNENGELKVKTDEVLEAWRRHYEDKFTETHTVASIGGRGQRGTDAPSSDEDDGEDRDEVTTAEVERAIERMKNGKAAGEDTIRPELIKAGGIVLVDEITSLFNACWQTGRVPKDWETSIIVPLYKKGDSSKCENYRAICLIDVIAKLYSRILEGRLRQHVEADLDEEQAGFRPGRQTQDLIFSLRSITDKWISRGQGAYLAFLDLKAAFDEVPREELWKALEKKQTPAKLLAAIKSLFHDPKGIIRLDGSVSSTFNMSKGVRQGDSLSPLLFIIFMDEVTVTCKRRTDKSLVGMRNLRPVQCQAMLYADDVVLIADSERKLQKAVLEWTETLKERGMTVNKDKSQVMMVARTEDQVEDIVVMCDGHRLTQVSSYQYLGTAVHQTGKLTEEVRQRVRKASGAYYAMNNVLFGKKEVSTKTKARVYTAIIEPILLYGAESWVAHKNEVSQVNAVQMKCCRRMVGKTRRDRIRNDTIREQTKLPAVSQRIEERQLCWYGHVARMHGERKPRQYMEAKAQGRRPIGRPRVTWEEKMTQVAAGRGKTLAQLRTLAQDRATFKTWTKGNPPTRR